MFINSELVFILAECVGIKPNISNAISDMLILQSSKYFVDNPHLQIHKKDLEFVTEIQSVWSLAK